MKLNISALLAAAALSTAIVATAVPAKRDKRVIIQPDGTTLTIYKIGDERSHYTLTEDGNLITEDENGQFSYANIDNNGAIISTKIKAVDANVRPASHSPFLKTIDDIDIQKIDAARSRANTPRKVSSKASASDQSGLGTFANFPKKGDIKGLIILVEFQDQSFKTSYSTSAKQYFTDMMNKTGFSEYGGTGCAKEYFLEQSLKQFRPQFTVAGPYKVSHNVSYYGGNDYYGNDTNPEEMVVEACQLADGDINFSEYDNDGDGYCDNVFVFYAGQGEATYGSSSTIWPHAYQLSYSSQQIKLDGVTIDRYACTNEWESSTPDGVGTFIHEFSHVMGLPDLYNTVSTSVWYTPGYYSVLDYGPYNNDGRTPPNYSIYERNAMGWIDLKLLDSAETISLGNIGETNEGCLAQTSKSTEFYLFENRQQVGWDKYIPNHGMLIWHIDYVATAWTNNVVNNTESHQYVDIVEANGNTDGSTLSIRKGWVWPGTSGKTSFTSSTTPAFKDWSGNAIKLPITNIAESNGIITFDVLGGSPSDVPEPKGDNEVEKGDDYFVAEWEPAKDATDYKLWVYATIDLTKSQVPGKYLEAADHTESETANMGSGTTLSLPTGWDTSLSTTDVYTGSTNSGESAPSAKFADNGKYIVTREYTEDVVGISFWMKGQGTGTSASKFYVTGLVDGQWVDLGDFAPSSTAATYTVQDIPEGVKQVKFVYYKDKGNVAIDDIVISLQALSYDEVLPDYNGIMTNGATSVRVDKLIDGCTTYKYQVASTPDGERFSKASDFVTINLGTTGVHSISADNSDNTNITVNDRTITVNTDASRVDIYSALGRHISSQRVSYGSAAVTMPTSGLYIVRTGNTATKVVVK